MPYHVAIDKVTERFLGNKKIGTTGVARPVLPGQDRPGRVRVADVLDESILTQKVEAETRDQERVPHQDLQPARALSGEGGRRGAGAAEGFKDRISDTRLLLNQALESGETVLLEGSQGTLLDVDHGTYRT